MKKNKNSQKQKKNLTSKTIPKVVRLRQSDYDAMDRLRPSHALALTRNQFTATTPLNLFNVSKGSTPGGSRVKGRELLGTVNLSNTVTGAFDLNAIVAQLGSSTATPILPAYFARLTSYTTIYEYYKFHKATIVFQSLSATSRNGVFMMALDYDYADGSAASSIAMMRNISSTMCNIYSDASMELDGKLSTYPKYRCAANVTASEASDDQKAQARLLVACEGVTGTAADAIGYIIVEYDVEFFTPQ